MVIIDLFPPALMVLLNKVDGFKIVALNLETAVDRLSSKKLSNCGF